MDILWQGHLLKAGNDNNRWKRRFYRLLVPSVTSSAKPRLEYYEEAPRPNKAQTPRGDLVVTDISGVLLLFPKNQPVPAQLEPFVDKSEHAHQGPPKMLVFSRSKCWRLGFCDDPAGIDFLPALERASTRLPRVQVRLSGWMKAQGTIAWNRRFALLLSSGDLLLFRDATLEHLRRHITLGEAHDIRPVHPLAPAGSASERRVVRVLEASDHGTELVPGVDGTELVGVCVRHPAIQERQGYVMCVEAAPGDDAFEHYARFRRWVVLLQLSASDARLASTGVSAAALTQTPPASSLHVKSGLAEPNDAQKLLRSIAETGKARSMVLAAHLASAGFPPELRGPLWAACSGAPFLKAAGPSYVALLTQSLPAATPPQRVLAALHQLEPEMLLLPGLEDLCRVALAELGEEMAFWTVAALVAGDEPGACLLPGFFFPGGLAVHVEAGVVLDVLGLAFPELLAHMSAYGLLPGMRLRLSDWLRRAGCRTGGACPTRVWDALSVLGRDALVRAAVAVLAPHKAQLMGSFAPEDADRAVAAALDVVDADDVADEAFSSIGALSRATEAAGQIRRAQWASLVGLLQGNGQLARAWLGTADHALALALDSVEECNRLAALAACPPGLEDVHARCVALAASARRLKSLAEQAGKHLQSEAARAGVYAQFTDPKAATRAQEGRPAAKRSAPRAPAEDVAGDSPAAEDLRACLSALGWTALGLAWRAWNAANRRAWRRLCFLYLPPLALLSQAPPQQQLLLQATAEAEDARSGSPPGPATGEEAEQDMEEDAGEQAGAFRRMAIGLGKRLQKRFLPKPDALAPAAQPLPPPALQRVGSGARPAVAAAAADWSAPHEERVFAKFRGGAVGLLEAAGVPAQVALGKRAALADARLVAALDLADVAVRLARTCDALAKRVELCARDAPPPLDLPLLRGMFPLRAPPGGPGLLPGVDELCERMFK